jgi:hypothetical protein
VTRPRYGLPFPGRTRTLGAPLPHRGPTRFLGMLLCYNDADILGPVIDHLAANRHDVVVWNHGSEDDTEQVARSRLSRGVVEYQDISREDVPFKDLYGVAARYLTSTYGGLYDWLSWPDQDEILEGPDLARPYHEQVTEALASGVDWVEFDNFVFWFTDEDDASVADPVQRVRRYNLSPAASPRVRAWRFALTNERRLGNSNPIEGRKAAANWPLRHYPMRSRSQAQRRARHDRNREGFQSGDKNWHYERFREDEETMLVPAAKLHRFDGRTLSRDITHTFYERPSRLTGRSV